MPDRQGQDHDRDRAGFGSWASATARCPKQMSHGPCAGVTAAGQCEVLGFGECTFTAVAAGDWPYVLPPDLSTRPGDERQAVRDRLGVSPRGPFIVTDLPAPPLSAAPLLASAAALAGSCDALLLGDHGGARLQFPPSYRVKLLADEGHSAWVGINCRDRNRVALEAEIAASLDAGAVGVHCVTGDHTQLGDHPGARPVFDLDSVDAVLIATARGALCSVAHAPTAVPVDIRLPRVLAKINAGAQVVFIDHCGGYDEVATAAAALRDAGFGGLVVVCVPVVTSAADAAVVSSFGSDRLPPGYVGEILAAADHADAGVHAAVTLARRLLRIPGVDGVNLSGGGAAGQELATALQMAEIGRQLKSARRPAARLSA